MVDSIVRDVRHAPDIPHKHSAESSPSNIYHYHAAGLTASTTCYTCCVRKSYSFFEPAYWQTPNWAVVLAVGRGLSCRGQTRLWDRSAATLGRVIQRPDQRSERPLAMGHAAFRPICSTGYTAVRSIRSSQHGDRDIPRNSGYPATHTRCPERPDWSRCRLLGPIGSGRIVLFCY